MEKWKEVFVGCIPNGIYQTRIVNSEETGLVLELKSNDNLVVITFGIVQAIRILDEGIVQKNIYSDSQVRRFKDNNFRNVIYEVQEGDFERQIQIIADSYWEFLDAKHYILVTQNFNIDIITEYEPQIECFDL